MIATTITVTTTITTTTFSTKFTAKQEICLYKAWLEWTNKKPSNKQQQKDKNNFYQRVWSWQIQLNKDYVN